MNIKELHSDITTFVTQMTEDVPDMPMPCIRGTEVVMPSHTNDFDMTFPEVRFGLSPDGSVTATIMSEPVKALTEPSTSRFAFDWAMELSGEYADYGRYEDEE